MCVRTFAVLCSAADVHPLLTLSAAHQETSHRLPGQEGIRLRYLRHKRTIWMMNDENY